MKAENILLCSTVRGSVHWISESCGQCYPISCDSLTEEMRRLRHRRPEWNSFTGVLHLPNIQLCPQTLSMLFGFTLIAHENTHTDTHTRACRHASGMFFYLRSIRASQNREDHVDIAEWLRRYCWLLYSHANNDLMSSGHYERTHTSMRQQTVWLNKNSLTTSRDTL